MALKRRIAIVGVGSIGRRHARLLSQRDDVTVEIIEPCEENLIRVRHELGQLTEHRNFEDMLKSSPDVVWITSPTHLHAEQAIAALEAGCHVFCEKPMSHNMTEGKEMTRVAERTGRILNIGFNLHFHPGLTRLKKMIDDDELGTIVHIHARVGTYITLVNTLSRHQANHEGSLMLDYAHQPDLFYWFLNEIPSHVSCFGLRGGELEVSSNPNVATLTLLFRQPLLATIHLNYVQSPERHEYEIVGDHGFAILDANEGTLTIGRHSTGQKITEYFECDRDDTYRAEHEAYLLTIDGKRNAETPPEVGLVSMAVCDAAIESWKTGRTVEVQRRNQL